METEWDQEDNQHLDELLLSSVLESSRISDDDFLLIEGTSKSKRVRLEDSQVTGESMANGDEDEEDREEGVAKKKKKLSRRQRKKAKLEREMKEQIEEEAVKEAVKPFLSKVEDGRPVVDVSTEITTDTESDNKEEKEEGGEFEEEIPESEIDESL